MPCHPDMRSLSSLAISGQYSTPYLNTAGADLKSEMTLSQKVIRSNWVGLIYFSHLMRTFFFFLASLWVNSIIRERAPEKPHEPKDPRSWRVPRYRHIYGSSKSNLYLQR